MGRILAIDYGTKRTGLAVTDPLKIIPQPLETLSTAGLLDFLIAYLKSEEVDCIVLGMPLYPDGNPAQIAHMVVGFERQLRKQFPGLEIVLWDERYSSEDAKVIIRQSGARMKQRRDKGLVDRVAASLILRDYLESEVW
ncbi:MAG: Holliday junction resolvase RuvX [Saprospiraceae bacterium]|nr:Holliday junction resolvase RuvX [Saprospiraceae bacterium]